MKSPERDFDRVFFRGHDKTAEVFITISIYGLPQQLPLHPLHPLQPLTILESVDGHLDNKKSMGGEVKFALLTFYYDHHASDGCSGCMFCVGRARRTTNKKGTSITLGPLVGGPSLTPT